jgi:hypothetical protein
MRICGGAYESCMGQPRVMHSQLPGYLAVEQGNWFLGANHAGAAFLRVPYLGREMVQFAQREYELLRLQYEQSKVEAKRLQEKLNLAQNEAAGLKQLLEEEKSRHERVGQVCNDVWQQMSQSSISSIGSGPHHERVTNFFT